jgi:hypothetical protein
MKECTGEAKEKEGEFDEMANSGGMAQKDFIFIRLPVLREVRCVCVCLGVCGEISTLDLSNFYACFVMFNVAVFGKRASY